MIKHFAEIIRNGLDDYAVKIGVDRTFCIFTDAGEYESVSYNPHEPRDPDNIAGKIYGILDADPSKLAPIPGLSVVTYSGTLEIMVEAKHDNNPQNGEFEEVSRIEGLLNAYGRHANGEVYQYTDKDEKEFAVTVNFSPAVVGDWQIHSTVFGEVIPVSMSIYLTAVENGVGSNDLKLWIDGYPVYYENLVLTRQKTPDQYTYEKNGSIKSTILQHAFGVDFTAPLLRGKLSDAILRENLDGSFNTPHVVTIAVNSGKEMSIVKNYLCTFGNSSLALQPGKNVGATVSLVEVKNDIAAFAAGVALQNLGEQWGERSYIERSFITFGDILDAPKVAQGSRCTFIAAALEQPSENEYKVLSLHYGSFCCSDVAEGETVVSGIEASAFVVRVSYAE